MPTTLLLDRDSWDLVVDAAGNIAVASEPYSAAQDAASACRVFRGELWFDIGYGIPYFQDVLAQRPGLAQVKSLLAAQAKTVNGVAAAQVFISSASDRTIRGQVQVTTKSGQQATAGF